MFVLAYESSDPAKFTLSSDPIYPTLEWAQKALEVKSFTSVLKYKIFALTPVEDSSPASPESQLAMEAVNDAL